MRVIDLTLAVSLFLVTTGADAQFSNQAQSQKRTVAHDTEKSVIYSYNYRGGGGGYCQPDGVPEVNIVKPPQHGTLRTPVAPSKVPECQNEIPAVQFIYRPAPGFVGQDEFTYVRRGTAMQTNGMDRAVTVLITVQ